MRSVHTLTCQQSGQREPCNGDCLLTTLLNPNGANTMALLTTQHSLVQSLGPTKHWEKTQSSCAGTDCGDLECDPGVVVVDTVRVCTGGAPQECKAVKCWILCRQTLGEDSGRGLDLAHRDSPGGLGCDLRRATAAIVSTLRSTQRLLSQWVYPRSTTTHSTLALDLGQTGPGRRLPEKQPKFLVAVQLPQFL